MTGRALCRQPGVGTVPRQGGDEPREETDDELSRVAWHRGRCELVHRRGRDRIESVQHVSCALELPLVQ